MTHLAGSEPSSSRTTRYAASGTRKTSDRLGCPCPNSSIRYGENPKKKPPARAGTNVSTRCRQSRWAVQAASAGAASSTRLKATKGPTAAVTGDMAAAGAGTEVTQPRLIPPGAHAAVV